MVKLGWGVEREREREREIEREKGRCSIGLLKPEKDKNINSNLTSWLISRLLAGPREKGVGR